MRIVKISDLNDKEKEDLYKQQKERKENYNELVNDRSRLKRLKEENNVEKKTTTLPTASTKKENLQSISPNEQTKLREQYNNLSVVDQLKLGQNNLPESLQTLKSEESLGTLKPVGEAVKSSKDINSKDSSKRIPAEIRYTLERGKSGIKKGIGSFFNWLQNETAGDYEKYANIDSNSLTSKLAKATMSEEDIEKARKDYQERIAPKYVEPTVENDKIIAGNANAEQIYQATLPTGLKTVGQVSETVGRMFPVIGASAINPLLGDLAMYGSTAGEEGSVLIGNGENIQKANKVARLKGGVEVGTEKLAGGIKFRGKGALDNIAGNFIANHTEKKVTNFLATKGYQVIGEIGEEHISNLAGYAIDKVILNKDTSLKEAWEDATETTKTTFLTTLALNMLGLGGENYSTNKTVNQQLVSEYEDITKTKLNEEQKNALLNEIETIKNEAEESQQSTQQLPTANQENTYSNKLKQQATEEINNSNVSSEIKNNMLDALNYVETLSDTDMEAIRQTIEAYSTQENETQQENKAEQLETRGNFKNDQTRRQKYMQYKNDISDYNSTVVNEVLDTIPENRNGRRTVKQWLKAADEIGTRIADLSNEEIEQIAYKSWFDLQPTKSITQYDNVAKQKVGFQKFTSDEWINTINNAVNEARTNNIEQGSFVSTSQNMARDYAGNGKIYSQEADLKDVAWINGDEGQYAKVENNQETLYNNNESESVKYEERYKSDVGRRVQDLVEKYKRGQTIEEGNSRKIYGAKEQTEKVTHDDVKKSLIEFATKYPKTNLNEAEIKIKNLYKNIGAEVIFYEYGSLNDDVGLADKNKVYIDSLGGENINNIAYHEAVHIMRQNSNPIFKAKIEPIINEIANGKYDDIFYKYAMSGRDTEVSLFDDAHKKYLAEEIVGDVVANNFGNLEIDYLLDKNDTDIIVNAFNDIIKNNTKKNSNESSFNLQEIQSIESPTGDKSISTTTTETEQQEIAKILDESITKAKEKSRWWAIAKANLLDKGIVFEELSHKTNNRELQGKWDYMLLSGARGQDAIGKPRYERDPKTKTEKQICKSLEDIKSEVGKNRSEFQNYMYHQLNIDRMSLKDRFGIDNKPVFGDNISAYYSKELVTEYEKNHPEFKEYAQDIYDFLDANKKELVDKGVISQELSDKLKELYPHYVPIKRVDKKGLAVKVPLDTYRTGINSPLAKATGGSSDIEPLFQTIANRTEQTYKASARNNFGVELMNTLNSITESSKVDVDSILEQIGDEDTELLKEGKNGENPTFTVFNNGEKVTFEITKDMYDALKPQSDIIKNINNSWISKGINKVSNFRRGILTEYNPVFSLTNAIKDAQDVVINSQHPAKTYAKFPEAYAQIMKKGYWYNEYVANGGEQNSYFKDGEFESDKKQSKLKTAVTMPLNAISKVNNVIEMAPRLAEYIASREAGRSVEVSMLDAARVTTNFKAGGDITKTSNRNGFTFLNASVQGFQQQVRNIQEANTKGLKGYAVLATKYAIAGLPAILLNNLIWKDDEDYQNLQDYAKDNYYIVAKLGNGKFLRIPKGRVAATVQKIVSNATEYITDDKQINIDNLAKDFYEDAKFARDNVAPNNPIENNILTPIFNVAQNKTWYGSDLVPKRLQDKPKNEQYDETTDSLSIWLGDKLNQSPYKINYLLDQYGGGVADIALPRFTKQAENNMLEDKFTTDAIMKNKYPGEFYDTLDKLKTKANSLNATDEDILRYKHASSNSSKMSELYKEKRDIQNSNKSDKQKKEELKSVQQKINNLAKQNLESAKDLKISGNTATIKDNQYYKVKNVSDETMEWKKVTDKEKEQNKNISLKTYADYKNKLADETIKQRKNGVITSEEQLKNKDKINVVLNSTYSNKEKSAIYENYIGKEDDVYQILKNTDININQYLKYKEQDFAADKIDDGTLSGKSVSGSKKEKIRSYIDDMQITYMQKLMLFGSQYTLSDREQTQIVNYIESLNKTRQEKLDMLSKFKGFTIYKDGRFTY